jgi:hypothetical protein
MLPTLSGRQDMPQLAAILHDFIDPETRHAARRIAESIVSHLP